MTSGAIRLIGSGVARGRPKAIRFANRAFANTRRFRSEKQMRWFFANLQKELGRAKRVKQQIPLLRRHVEEIASARGIVLLPAKEVRKLWPEALSDIRPGARTLAQAFEKGKLRVVATPTIRNRSDYLMALHEIGHLTHPKGSQRATGMIPAEVNAWRYSLDTSLIKPPRGARRMIKRTLGSYAEEVLRRHGLRPQKRLGTTFAKRVGLPLDSDFWQLAATGSLKPLRGQKPAKPAGMLFERRKV